MNSSAIRSSSAVVIPGCTCSPRSAIVSATSSPARAMPSISCPDLRMIKPAPPTKGWGQTPSGSDPFGSDPSSSRFRGSCGNLLQCRLDLGEDLVLAASPVNRHQVAAYAVVLDQRLRLAVVVLEAAPDRLVR